MSPALFDASQLRRSELRVVDKNIRPRRKLLEAQIQCGIAGLVVRGINDRSCRGFDAESQAALRVINMPRGDFVLPDHERFPAFELAETTLGAHGREINGEIRQGHLGLKHLPQGILAKEFGAKAVELELIFFDVKGGEKRQTLNVVPMI